MTVENANLGMDLLLDADNDLQVSQAGDLVVTGNGRECLLQDIRNLLDTLPGDLFGHPEYGAGLHRLVGEEDRFDFDRLVTRAITDALTYGEAVAPRITPDSVTVTVTRTVGQEAEYSISFAPIGEDLSSLENLVWRF